MLIEFGIEIRKFFLTVFLVALQIKICTGMNAFHFFKSDRERIFYVAGSVGIMGEFYMVMKTEFVWRYSQAQVPFHPGFFPVFIPFFLSARANEKLHLHLFELPHTEDKLTGDNLVPECFARLGYPKWNFQSACFLHVQEIHKNA